MSTRRGRHILALLRAAVCIGALAWVLQGVTVHDHATLRSGEVVRLLDLTGDGVTIRTADGREQRLPLAEVATEDTGRPKITIGLASAWRGSHKAVLPLSLVLMTPVVFLQSLRFLMMMRAQDVHLGYWQCMKLSFAGNFLNFVALGSTGGDVVKAYYVCLHTDRRTEAVTTLFLDRIIGLTGLVAVVGLVILFFTRDPLLRFVGYVIAAFLAGLVVVGTLLVSEGARRFVRRIVPTDRLSRVAASPQAGPGVSRRRLAAIVAWCVEQVRRVDATTRRFIGHKPLVLASILITMALQFVVLAAYQPLVYGLGMLWDRSSVWEYYAFLGSGNVAAALPITYQGVGVMEALYKKLMAGGHGTMAQILCLAMAVRIVHLIWALPGFFVTLTGAYRPLGPNRAAPHPTRDPRSETRPSGSV